MIVGVTGSFGSGKSTVSDFLRQRGAVVLDADKTAHQCLQVGHSCYDRIAQLFGSSKMGEDHQIDRRRLGKVVFSNVKKLKRLTQVIHPCVRQKFKEETQKILERDLEMMIVFDVPLLFESGMDREVDVIVVATTTLKKQTERAIQCFGLTEQEVLRRIHAQLSLQEKAMRADFVVSTSGSLDETKDQVEKLCQQLQLLR